MVYCVYSNPWKEKKLARVKSCDAVSSAVELDDQGTTGLTQTRALDEQGQGEQNYLNWRSILRING